MRSAYLNELLYLALQDERVISIIADNGMIVFDDYRKKLPAQYLNFGISEAHMVTAAAGMATCGKIPFVYTISSFLIYHAYEQIRNDVCIQNLNVKIIGIGSGMSYSTLGPTHHTTEDIGILYSLPNMRVYSPCSPYEVKEIVKEIYRIEGPAYIRLGSNNEMEIYDNSQAFHFERINLIKSGNKIVVFTMGTIICEVLKAADILKKQQIDIAIAAVHSIKPFDVQGAIKIIQEADMVFSVEEHNINGGFGSILSDVIALNRIPVNFVKIGLQDQFGKFYGTLNEVREQNGLSGLQIAERIKYEIERVN